MDAEVTLGDVDLTVIKARSISGIVTLISRSFFIQLVSTLGFFLLSIFLARPEIGLFIAVNELVSILGYFSDVGLAASLIQKKDKVSLTDLRTTFTLQQILVLVLVISSLLLSPYLFSYYHVTGAGTWLFYSLLTAFFLASLKTIPSVVLERQLRFEILAFIEIVETLVFYTIAVTLAWQGRGVTSYAWAVFIRGLVGSSLIYILAPWKIGFSISVSSLKSLLSFGLPYQINSLMAVVKDRFLNIFLWKIIGADGVGIIGWAQTWSQKPLRFVMDNVTKVTFPSFSRLQEHPDQLRRGIEKTLFFISLITFPIVAGMAVIAPSLVKIIPKYSKWEVALIPLALFCFNSAWAAISTPLTNTLNALGKVKINTYLMIMWTVLAWGLTPFLAIKYGFLGVAYATAVISLTSIIPVLIVKNLTGFSLSPVLKPSFATLIMLIVSRLLTLTLTPSLVNIFINVIISGLVFCLTIYLLVGPSLFADVKKLLAVFKKK